MKADTKLYVKLKNRRSWIILGCIALACMACFLSGLTQQDNVKEVVVRNEIVRWRIGAGNARPLAAVFVSFEGRDPSNDFIERFRGGNPVVYKLSQGTRRVPGDIYTQYWINSASGLRGGAVDVGKVVWLGPFMARVEINYPTSGSVSTVTKSISGWTVIARQQTWLH